MKELKITKEKIQKLADGLDDCRSAQQAVKDAFPEAFEEEEEGWRDITGEVKIYLENRDAGYRLFMDDGDGNYFARSQGKIADNIDFIIPMSISCFEIGDYKATIDSRGCFKILKRRSK